MGGFCVDMEEEGEKGGKGGGVCGLCKVVKGVGVEFTWSLVPEEVVW